MTGTTFLALADAAAVLALLGAWLVAQREHARTAPQPTPPAPTTQPAVAVDVVEAYRAAIIHARQQPTRELLARLYALDQAPTSEQLLDWLAARHVLVAERDVALFAAPTAPPRDAR